jgi:hypothetical protein
MTVEAVLQHQLRDQVLGFLQNQSIAAGRNETGGAFASFHGSQV